jgi:hypothetical protein
MRLLLTVLAALVITLSGSSSGYAQASFDTSKFAISALIKPSDYAQWPDSVAAWRVYADYDLDKDGKKEFLVIVDPASTSSDTSMPRILRFEANGNNKYDLVWSTQIPGSRSGVYSWPCLTVADLDKDGAQEIIYGQPINGALGPNINPPVLYIYEYSSDSSNFLSEPTMMSNLGFPDKYYYAITSIVADDVDADGDIELVLSARRAYGGGWGTASTRPLFIYHLLGDVSPGFSSFEREFADTIGTFNGGYYFNNHVLDFDGDGKKEIWGFTWDLLSFGVYEATGKDTYVLQCDVNQAAASDYGEQNSVSFYDANKDGKLEMFVAGQTSPPSAAFYVGNVSDVSTLTTASVKYISPIMDIANFQGATIGDIDGDGEVDFFIGDWSTERKVYRLRHIKGAVYDDSLGYALDTLYSAPFDSTYEFPNVTYGNDLDGDNKRELFIVNTNTRVGYPDPSIIILESKVVVLGVQQISSTVPSGFTLEQNFPNPFNPTSTIRFSLKTQGHVELFITNSLGQQVGSLVNGQFEAGTHEVTFNADGLASGTYFYTLKAGTVVETKKMLFMK